MTKDEALNMTADQVADVITIFGAGIGLAILIFLLIIMIIKGI